MDARRGLQAGADALLGALELERAGDDAAQRRAPSSTSRPAPHRARRRGSRDRARKCTLSLPPSGMSWGRASQASSAVKHGDRGEPRGEEGEQLGHHRARGAPAQRVGRIAVDRVLADVEIERREVDGAEIVQLGRDACGSRNRRPPAATLRIELGQAMQHPALELGHLGVGHLLRPPIAVEAAQQVAQGVAQPAIGLGLVLQDLRADALVLGVVGADHPQAQDVGAVLVAHRLRRGDVAQRLRHLAALLVEREAVRQHAVIGRAAARAAALEQRGMEPAAMLVGALEIEVGRPLELGIALEREDVGAAGVEPDVEDVRRPARSRSALYLLPRKRSGGLSNHASAPSASKASTTRPMTSGSRSGSPVALSTNTAIGTPQARWRDTHQSGRARSSRAAGCSRRAARSAWRRSPPAPCRAGCRRSRRSACPWR